MAITGLLIDTNAYAAIANNHADALDLVRKATHICISIVSIGELLAGFASGARERQNRRLLEDFIGTSGVSVLFVARTTAEAYARVVKATRAVGRPIPTNDIWIAATAIEHSLPLFTYDRHFDWVPGLRSGATWADLHGTSSGA